MPPASLTAGNGAHPPSSELLDATLPQIVERLVGWSLAEVERELLLCTLAHHDGNRTHAANILGISVRTMRNKINECAALGFAVPGPRPCRE